MRVSSEPVNLKLHDLFFFTPFLLPFFLFLADVALTSETVETYHTDTACQTDRLVDCASCAAVQKLRCQLRAAKQQLRQCQTKLAEFRKKTAKYERQQQSLQRLPDREKLIIDQCVMKANAKSARAVR